jgi:threonine dehydrogenase-like Zn-dependent dehydrogenase
VCRLSTYSQVRSSVADTALVPAASPPSAASGGQGDSSSFSARQIDHRPGMPWVACSSTCGRMPNALRTIRPMARGMVAFGRKPARWGVRPGDRVAVEILIPCRSCDLCLAGRYMSCRHRIGSHGGSNPPERGLGPWGGFAEYIHLHPNAILHKVRNDIPAEVAVMFNPLGAGVRWAVHLGGAGLGDTVLILGCGQRGLAAVLASRAAGAGTIIVTGLSRDAAKLELAREFGADHVIGVEAADTVGRVREITGGTGADVVLELTPMATQPVRDALDAVRWGGRVVLAGLKGGQPVELPTDLIINKAITVAGAFSVDSRAYAEAIRLIEAGSFPLARMHTHTFGLDEVARAIETLADDGTAVHVAILPGG